jgi:hypothetical protein
MKIAADVCEARGINPQAEKYFEKYGLDGIIGKNLRFEI